ncbi:MAG: hypothetical protein PHO27_06505 [Sulfuricurvum sp.]|nr:hypothetical protein [Sulfuricurvum sp.]
MNTRLLLVAFLFGLLTAGCGNTDKKDAVVKVDQSCYEQYFIKTDNSNPIRQVFIIVDQTTVFNDAILKNLLEKVQPLFIAGSKITLVKFSTFTDKYYTSVVKETFVDTPLSQEVEDDTPIAKVKKFKRCIDMQSNDIANEMPTMITETMKDSNSSIEQSEILKTLKDIADTKVQKSKAQEKIIILVSDMVENSSMTSFYQNNNLKVINPSIELSKTKAAGLLSDFDGAKVYVVGAGLVMNSHTSRSIASIKELKEFWTKYFATSNATLVGFGTPELMEDIVVDKK